MLCREILVVDPFDGTKIACEQALLGVGGGRGNEERACNDVSGICMPPPILPAATRCKNLANQRKPETIVNVNTNM